jgi:hypothetical protein
MSMHYIFTNFGLFLHHLKIDQNKFVLIVFVPFYYLCKIEQNILKCFDKWIFFVVCHRFVL